MAIAFSTVVHWQETDHQRHMEIVRDMHKYSARFRIGCTNVVVVLVVAIQLWTIVRLELLVVGR